MNYYTVYSCNVVLRCCAKEQSYRNINFNFFNDTRKQSANALNNL